MKVVLSRKGFDSGYGGYPSIILPNKEMITFPIPSSEEDIFTYSDIKVKDGTTLYEITKSISNNIKSGKTIKLTKSINCHLDPDLCEYSIERNSDWKGAFGQISAAEKELENNDVKEGDLFLFFGWFNDVIIDNKKYRFKKGDGRHTLFGYL